MTWIRPTAVHDGGTCLGQDLAIRLDRGRLIDMVPAHAQPDATPSDTTAAFGLFDTQVNGGGDVMLNNEPTAQGVLRIAEAHRAMGTEFLLPTVITDTPDVIRRAAEAVLEMRGKSGVLGIHIEGPHINLARRGIHRADCIRPFDDVTMDLVRTLRIQDCPVLLTLAPECVSLSTIAELDRMGVVVSAGHSMATAEELRAAADAVLRSVTHLHNGMPPMENRNPGLVGAALLSDLWCGVIADGHHVAPDMLRLTINARPSPDRMVLMSDAMSTVGGRDHLDLYGETIRVHGGKLINKDGSLAGAQVTLCECVRFWCSSLKAPLSNALHMASDAPFELMGLNRPGDTSGRVMTQFPSFRPRLPADVSA